MSSRSTFWLAASALLVAAVAFPLALVSVIRAGDEPDAAPAAATAAMAGREDEGMAGDGGMAGHGASAPMEGVPDATAERGGEVLEPRVEDGVWVYELVTKAVRWETCWACPRKK